MELRKLIERAYDGGPEAIEKAITDQYLVTPRAAIRQAAAEQGGPA